MWIKTQQGRLVNLDQAQSVGWWKNYLHPYEAGTESVVISVEVNARFPGDVIKLLGIYDDMQMAHDVVRMIQCAMEPMEPDGQKRPLVFEMPTAERMQDIREASRRVFGDDDEILPAD